MALDKLEFFKSAEQEYIDFTQAIETSLHRAESQPDGKKADTLDKVSKKIKQAQRSIQTMEMELSSASDIQTRQKLTDRVKGYSQQLARYEKQVKELRKNSERSALLSGAGDRESNEDHRTRLAMSTNRLKDTTKSLDNALHILENTEALGAEAALMTKEQGDRMRNAKDRLHEINAEVGRGSRIISRISRRQMTNKIILIIIILVILLAIFLVIFFAILLPIILKFKNNDSKQNSIQSLISGFHSIRNFMRGDQLVQMAPQQQEIAY